MSLLDDASLVVVPSGYKAGTVYSVKPTNGDGDLDFTRSNDTATRVNSAGLIEKVRTNLLAHSEEFTTANGWGAGVIGASTATQTSNYGIAPNGTMTADRIQLALNGDAYADWVRPTSGFVIGQSYTYSIYLKSLTGSTTLEFFNNGASGILKTITTEWVRYTHSFTASSATIYPRFLLIATTSSTADLLAWGYQLETGDIATDYIPTTSAAVSVGMTANVPRLDYSGGGCPKLLLEPQRTNLVTFSEQMDNSDWGKSNATITANDTASPDGYTNADKITDNANNTQHRVTQNISVTSGTSYTASIFVKNDDKGDFTINFTTTGFPSTKIVFNLINGTVTSGTGTIEDYGNGWYRISATAEANATGSGTIGFNLADGSAYVGTGESVFIWGAQIEAGSYVSSYIPTLGAAVTRGADACFKTGISSLIGQTEGVLYAEIDLLKSISNRRIISINDGTGNNDIRIGIDSSNFLQFAVIVGGVVQCNIFTSYTIGLIKIAVAYALNDFALYINGTLIGTDTSGTIPTTSNINLGTNTINTAQLDDRLAEAILFPTRLTNTQLSELTTL